MASGAKTALMFALMAAMAVAAQVGSHNVSCTNHYGKPVTVNGVVIGVSLTVNVHVDDVLESLTCVVPDILGEVVVETCSCPSNVTAVTLVELDGNFVVEAMAVCTLTLCPLPMPLLFTSTLHCVGIPKPVPQVTFKYNYPYRLLQLLSSFHAQSQAQSSTIICQQV